MPGQKPRLERTAEGVRGGLSRRSIHPRGGGPALGTSAGQGERGSGQARAGERPVPAGSVSRAGEPGAAFCREVGKQLHDGIRGLRI